MNSKYKRCPYCGEEILAVAKKCRYCGEWLDKTDMPDTPQQAQSEETEDYSEEEPDEKPSFIKRTWKVLLSVFVIILLCVGKIGLKEFGKDAVKEATKEQATQSESSSDVATESEEDTYAFQYLSDGKYYNLYLTDGKGNMYEYDDEVSYEDFIYSVIAAKKLVLKLFDKDMNESQIADIFNKYGRYMTELPIKKQIEWKGVNLTEILNKAYYDWNPYKFTMTKTGYGYQTYECPGYYSNMPTTITFSRGDNGGIKITTLYIYDK